MIKIKPMKLILTLLLLSVMLLAGCTQQTGDNEFYLKGKEYLENYQYSLALEQFKLSLNNDSAHTGSYLKAAQIYQIKGNTDEAIDLLTSGLDYAKDRKQLDLLLSNLMLEKGEFVEAIKAYEAFLEKESNNNDAIKGKLLAMAMINDETKLTEYTKSLNTENLNSENKLIISFILAATPEDAIQVLEQINEQSNNVASLKEKLADLYNKIITADEDLYNFAQIAYIAVDAGYPEVSLPVTTQIDKLNKYYEGIYVYRAVAQSKYKQFAQAEENLKKALEYNPKQLSSILLLTENYFGSDQADKAVDFIKANLVNLGADESRAVEAITILSDNNKLDIAFEMANKYESQAVKITKNYLFAKFKLLINMGKMDKAEKVEKDLMTYFEEFDNQSKAEIYAYSGWLKFKKGEKSTALDLIKQSQSLNRLLPETYYFEGLILLDQQKLEEARTALNKAIDLDLTGRVSLMALEALKNI